MLPQLEYDLIGKRVRSARLRKGYSQEMLAEKIDCSNNYISHIETGQTKVSLKILTQIAYATDKPLDYFLSDTPYASVDYLIDGEFRTLIESCNRSTLIAAKRMLEVLVKHQKEMEQELLG